MRQEDVTIIIPTLATPFTSRALKYCFESLRATFTGKIIVSVNGKERRRDIYHDLLQGPTDILQSDTQGQCNAVNQAVKESTTPWIMIVNDDMVFPPGWFKKFTDQVDRFKLLVASPNLVEPRRGAPPFLEYFCGGIGTEGTTPDFDKQKFLDFAETYKEHPNKPYQAIENGFNLPFLIRRDVWDTIGGYDIAYDPWSSCSDTDLQTRIIFAGITPKRVRTALVYHFGQTSGTFSADRESFRHTNWRYYKAKFGFDSFKNPDVWYLPTIPEDTKFHPPYKNKYANSN